MELQATTLGVFPLPDEIRDRLADLKGHQKGDLITGDEGPPISTAYDEGREIVTEDQVAAGLDRLVDGQLRWDDMLAHPLIVADGTEPGGIVRYYDNNNFYRDPIVTGPLQAAGDLGQALQTVPETGTPRQAIVPDPWTLADLATDEYYDDLPELLEAVTDLLVTEVRRLPAHETLVLPAPSLVTAPPGAEHGAQVREAIDAVADATDAETLVAPFYGVPDESTYAHLVDADAGVGYDLVSDHEGAVELAGEYGTTDSVLLGVVNGQHTAVEPPETIRDRAEWFAGELPSVTVPDRAFLAPNRELFYLPVERYQRKLEALGQATARREVEA
ncbi:MAG: 5-methyltetrahydropteroyltriglutamate--homocysteine methyltransferase [Halobacteriaceae archaeon]